jgi:hypothetical protein
VTPGEPRGGRCAADTALLSALAGGQQIEAAAKMAGVSESTAKRRLADPVFRARLDAIRAEAINRAVGVLSMASVGAAAELLRLIKSANSEQVRLAAATRILELEMKLRESYQIEERLAALERLAAPESASAPPRLLHGGGR